ncbi:hypothetical protein ACN6KF_001364 [Labrys sp. La1]|uniref:hypothetical protein n=1 Tax=Labrys sp. La1 TaxID=3404917 RepID=UPI003EBAB306
MTAVDAGMPEAGPAPTIIGVPNEPRAQLVLRSAEFRRGREESWRELEDLVARVEKRGIHGVSADELQKMPLLYRSALSSLSVARSIALDRNLLRYLEALTLRAYLVVYGPRTSLLAGLGHFFRYGFPDAVRKAGWHILIAFAAMALGIAAGFVLVTSEAEWFNAIVPDGLAGGGGRAPAPNICAACCSRPGTASRRASSSLPITCSRTTAWSPSSPSGSVSWPACRPCCCWSIMG